MSNFIFEVDGVWRLGNGEAESVQTFETFEDAKEASKIDEEAYETAADEAEAQEISVIDWE